MQYVIFFVVGFLQDLLITFYYQSIAKDKAGRSALLSSIVTLVNILVLYELISGVETQVFSVILAYALGNGLGTYVVVQRHERNGSKNDHSKGVETV